MPVIMKKGKILKIKLGYNPNSSTVAMIVNYLFWGAAAVGLLVNCVASIISVRKKKIAL